MFSNGFRRSVWGAFTVLLLVGCGAPDASQLAGNGAADRLLLVIMGGNQSCGSAQGVPTPRGMDMYGPFERLRQSLEARGNDVDYLLTCYTTSATVQTVSSQAPNTVQPLTREAFQAKLAGMRYELQSTRVVLAGHSYGGWLAMKTAQELPQSYDSLFTIDPISRETCTFSRPLGCTTAPGDISDAARRLIKSRSALWSNFYQTQTGYLHSSAITQADENQLLATSHVAIDSHQAVWQRLADAVENRF